MLQDFRLLSKCNWGFQSSVMVCSIYCLLCISVLGQSVSPTFERPAVQKNWLLDPWRWNWLSQNTGEHIPTTLHSIQNTEDLSKSCRPSHSRKCHWIPGQLVAIVLKDNIEHIKSHFLNAVYRYLVVFLGWGFGLSQNRGQHEYRRNTDIHSCPNWDMNPQPQYPCIRKLYMP